VGVTSDGDRGERHNEPEGKRKGNTHNPDNSEAALKLRLFVSQPQRDIGATSKPERRNYGEDGLETGTTSYFTSENR